MSNLIAIEENGKEFTVSIDENSEWKSYWDGESWIPVGYHYDASRVIQKDTYDGQWKLDAKLFLYNANKEPKVDLNLLDE